MEFEDTPSTFKKSFPDEYKRLRKQFKSEIKRAIKAGWRPRPGGPGGTGRAIAGGIAVFSFLSQTACALDAIANNNSFRNFVGALEKGDIDAANKRADDIYIDLVASGNTHAALQWKAYWAELQKEMAEELYNPENNVPEAMGE